MTNKQFKGKLKRDVKRDVLYAAGTDIVVIGQTDGATTLNTGGLAFCCLMPDGNIENIQDYHIVVDAESFSTQDSENITKREKIAARMMAAIISNQASCKEFEEWVDEGCKDEYECVARAALYYADALLEELSKPIKIVRHE